MPVAPPLRSTDFYEKLPTTNHRTGDIWRDLPTFGLLHRETASGIVITPACDLANGKCETLTYLPIISLDEYLLSPSFRFECWMEISSVLTKLPLFKAVLPPSRFDLLPGDEYAKLVEAPLDSSGKPLPSADIARISAYGEYLNHARFNNGQGCGIRAFFKPDRLQAHVARLITNSLKPDVHFLPCDDLPPSYSAITRHSLVLFRNTLTIPIAALSLAQNTLQSQWAAVVETHQRDLPTLTHLKKWPIKLTALRGQFLSDLLTRYINLYIRLGSADFAEDSIEAMAIEIGAHL